eukprot:PhF_6_TR21644/c0_g1_i1/m.30813
MINLEVTWVKYSYYIVFFSLIVGSLVVTTTGIDAFKKRQQRNNTLPLNETFPTSKYHKQPQTTLLQEALNPDDDYSSDMLNMKLVGYRSGNNNDNNTYKTELIYDVTTATLHAHFQGKSVNPSKCEMNTRLTPISGAAVPFLRHVIDRLGPYLITVRCNCDKKEKHLRMLLHEGGCRYKTQLRFRTSGTYVCELTVHHEDFDGIRWAGFSNLNYTPRIVLKSTMNIVVPSSRGIVLRAPCMNRSQAEDATWIYVKVKERQKERAKLVLVSDCYGRSPRDTVYGQPNQTLVVIGDSIAWRYTMEFRLAYECNDTGYVRKVPVRKQKHFCGLNFTTRGTNFVANGTVPNGPTIYYYSRTWLDDIDLDFLSSLPAGAKVFMSIGIWEARNHTTLYDFFHRAVTLARRVVRMKWNASANGGQQRTVVWVGMTSMAKLNWPRYRPSWSLRDATRPWTNAFFVRLSYDSEIGCPVLRH